MIIYGPLTISGSTNLSGSLYSKNLMYATASWALNTKTSSYVSGSNIVVNNLTVTGTLNASQISSSKVYVTSSKLVFSDNILTLNANSPYLRYSGLEMYDSGSGKLSNLLWDSQGNYFFISSSDARYSRKIITGPDNEGNLTTNYIPVTTGSNGLKNSIIYQTPSNNIGIGTINPSQKLSVFGRVAASTGSNANISYGSIVSGINAGMTIVDNNAVSIISAGQYAFYILRGGISRFRTDTGLGWVSRDANGNSNNANASAASVFFPDGYGQIGLRSAPSLAYSARFGISSSLHLYNRQNGGVGAQTSFERAYFRIKQGALEIGTENTTGSAYRARSINFVTSASVAVSADGNISNVISAPSRLFISSSGLIGIGTTTPTTKLEVIGDIKANAITASLLLGTSSYSRFSVSSSYSVKSRNSVSSSFAITSSYSKESTMAATASYALNSGCDCNLAIAYAIALG